MAYRRHASPERCHLSGNKNLTCPTANISGTFNLSSYGAARRLIRDGYPLDTEVVFWREETPVIRKATIGHLARYTLQETDRRGLELRKRCEPQNFQAVTNDTRRDRAHHLSAYTRKHPSEVEQEDSLTRIIIAALCTMLLAACTTQQSVQDIGQTQREISRDASVYVAVPDDGQYGETTYTGSGENTAQVITGAFAAQVRRADQGRNFPNQEAALNAARSADAGYIVVPQITHWEDRATEWSGIPDEVEVLISVYETRDESLVDKARIRGTSSWWTLGGDEPQDLLDKPVRDYVSSLIPA